MKNTYLPRLVLQVGEKEREEGIGRRTNEMARRKECILLIISWYQRCAFELALIFQSCVEMTMMCGHLPSSSLMFTSHQTYV